MLKVISETSKLVFKEERVLNKKKCQFYKEIQTLKNNSEKFDQLLENATIMRELFAQVCEIIRRSSQGNGIEFR